MRQFFVFGTLASLVATASFAQAAVNLKNDWLIVPGVRVGPITPLTTRSDLVRIFGANHVVDTDVTVSDAGPTPATVVNGHRSGDSLSIFWAEGKPDKQIDFIAVCLTGTESAQSESVCRWHTPNNIRMGTTLKFLQRLNGRPFEVSRFGWDYSGTVMDWKGGTLEPMLRPNCGGVGLRVNPLIPKPSQTETVFLDQMSRGKTHSSASQGMQALNPTVDTMNVSFEGCTRLSDESSAQKEKQE